MKISFSNFLLHFTIFFVFMLSSSLICYSQEEEPEDAPPAPALPPEILTECPYISGISNYILVDQQDKEFDYYNFIDDGKPKYIEGKRWRKGYQIIDSTKKISNNDIIKFYKTLIKQKDGRIVFEDKCEGEDCEGRLGLIILTGKIVNKERELWIEVSPYNEGNNFELIVYEKGEMKQDISPTGLFNTLALDGKIILYFNFDDKNHTINADSKLYIDALAQMMKENIDLIISVEAHTDNKGNRMDNQELSDAHAKIVFDALIAKGVDNKRMSSAGWGGTQPLVENDSDEGLRKNRRIEIIKKN